MSSSKEQPRGRKERFIVIPFSSTCRSASSVDVVQSTNKHQGVGGAGEVTSAAAVVGKPHKAESLVGGSGGGAGEVTSAPPSAVGKPHKPESLSLVARLLRGFKNLSHQIFAVHDEDDQDEEEEQEMVIGLPTDVKHVAHIGWDGSTSTTNSLRSWNRAAPPPTDAASTSTASSSAAVPLPPPQSSQALSVRQFELAMAAQASAAAGTSGSGSGASSTAQRRHRHYS